MMEYLTLPPELNSARMYAGPGATPLIQAAVAWETLAAQLGTTSEAFGQVVSGLTEVWRGPSSLAMAGAAAGYQAWLATIAEQASGTGARALAVASAYETAFATTVPPPLIAANRSLLASLVATNFLGINTPAIMATEAQYMQMWAQDVVAMVQYQLASAEAALGNFMPQSFSDLMGAAQAVTGLGGMAFAPVAGVMDEGLWGSPQQQQGQADAEQPCESGGSPVEVPAASDGPRAVPAVSVGQSNKVGGLSVPQSWRPSTDPTYITAEQATPGAEAFPAACPLGIGSGSGRPAERARYGIPIKHVVPRHPSGG